MMVLYLELITPPSPQKCEPPSPFYLPPDSNTNQFCSRVPRSPSGWWRVPGGHYSPMPGWRGSPPAGTGGHSQMSVDWGDPGRAETVTSVTTHDVRRWPQRRRWWWQSEPEQRRSENNHSYNLLQLFVVESSFFVKRKKVINATTFLESVKKVSILTFL